MVKFVSTRGQAGRRSFQDVLLAGLAEDGGLFVPESWPQLDLERLSGLSYADTVIEVMRPFVDDCFDDHEWRGMCELAYTCFEHPAVAPLVQLDHDVWMLELFHGPTLAFKDFALQLLGRMFECVLDRTNRKMTIVGATSGDTGSAAIHACAGRRNIDICILHPEGRVSDVQRRQMTTRHENNLRNIAIQGTFDDCQNRVKDMFNDATFRADMGLGAINSINFARLAAQVAYYVYAALRLKGSVSFSVPTGNFGDVYAGYMALRMGLPIDRLIVATNRNDILTRFFESGDYRSEAVVPTMSPSMDIQISSNFERLLFDILGRNGKAVADIMGAFRRDGEFHIEPNLVSAVAPSFRAARVDEDKTLAIMQDLFSHTGYICDPHTAVGASAGQAVHGRNGPLVILATAHPAKFPKAVQAAIGREASLPSRLAGLFDKEERFDVIANDLDHIQNYIRGAFA